LYHALFGPTFYSFQYGNAAFFILDTEIDQCNLSGEQLLMLETGIDAALENKQTEQIYIMMHKVLFLNSPQIAQNPHSLARPNDRDIFHGNNFDDVMNSLLVPSAKRKPLYLFAGDVGAFGGNLSPFYHKDKRADIFMYAAGIGDHEDDVVFLVTNTGKNVRVEPYRLMDGKILQLEDYSLQAWENYGRKEVSLLTQAKELFSTCTLGVCRFANSTFHIQCRYFMLMMGGLLLGLFLALVKAKKSRKDK